MDPTPPAPPLRLGVAEGIIPATWVRRWAERRPRVELELVPCPPFAGAEALDEAGVDAGIFRVAQVPPAFHAIALFEEVPVVIAPKDHFVAAAEEITRADLAGENVHLPPGAPPWEVGRPAREGAPDVSGAVELAAAGAGVVVGPMSLARFHHRKDLIHRPVTDLPRVAVHLVWRGGDDNPLIEELIGVVRGRTRNSTRGRGAPAAPKRNAAQKAAARREFLARQRGGRPAPRRRRGR